MTKNDMKWFERDPLPRAVIDRDENVWVYDINATITGSECTYMSDRGWYFASDLEDCFGPCTPLVPENGVVPADDALTVPAGELQLALGSRGQRILDAMNEAAAAGDIGLLRELAGDIKSVTSVAQAISLASSEYWALTPLRDDTDGEGNV